MKINENTIIIGNLVILVPYCKEHVPKYYEWMQDEWLREMTASDPLSLEEEYENQESWHTDEKKLTFIILDKSRSDTPETGIHGGGMAGDVNMFFHDFDDEGVAEINTMIADPSSRRKGLAKEALCLMMKYVMENLKVTKFVAKISDSNEASLNLFRSFFKFDQTGRSDAFEETTLEAVVSDQFKSFIEEHTKGAITDAQGYDKS